MHALASLSPHEPRDARFELSHYPSSASLDHGVRAILADRVESKSKNNLHCVQGPRALSRPFLLYARMFGKLAGESPVPTDGVKGSEAAGRHREWGLKEAWSKDTGRWTKLDLRPTASDERATDRESVYIQGRWW